MINLEKTTGKSQASKRGTSSKKHSFEEPFTLREKAKKYFGDTSHDCKLSIEIFKRPKFKYHYMEMLNDATGKKHIVTMCGECKAVSLQLIIQSYLYGNKTLKDVNDILNKEGKLVLTLDIEI